MGVTSNLEPKKVFYFFEEISHIPHGSYNTKKISDYLANFAKERGLEYVQDELKDLFALTDLVLSRAGANSICELLALRKPNLLIPLSAAASRGDQILNADSYQKQGYSLVLKEESLTPESLLTSLRQLWTDRKTYVAAMEKSSQSSAIDIIMGLITETA